MTNHTTGGQSVASRIRTARDKQGLGARELDRLAGLKQGHTTIIESRDGDIETETAAKIAKALGVSLEWLVTGVGDGPSAHTNSGNGFAGGVA